MLSYTKSAVTRNQSEKKINSLLDHVSQSSDMKLLQDFYSITLASLAEANNERLWFKTQLKLCGLWFKLKEFSRMHKILKELHKYAPVLAHLAQHWSCSGPAISDMPQAKLLLMYVKSIACWHWWWLAC